MKAVFNATLYIVFCRDTNGNLYVLHGNKRSGVYASRLNADHMRARNQFDTVHDHGMDRREFLALHKALETETNLWEPKAEGVSHTLLRDTVFYRQLCLSTRSTEVNEHHRMPVKKTPQFYHITGATCHYRTTTITLIGQSKGSELGCESFVHQIYREAAKQGWKVEHHTVTGTRRTKELGVECTVQFTFQIGTLISRVRKHMLEVFKNAS